MIQVTKTFLPPLNDYNNLLKKVWENQWLSNNGELLKELSFKLKKKLGANNILLMTNGTLPIQIALNKFGREGEIITTPFLMLLLPLLLFGRNVLRFLSIFILNT